MCPTGEDSLVHVSQDALPGDAFALSLNKVWEVIKSQKDLNLPAHKVCCLRCGDVFTILQPPNCFALGQNRVLLVHRQVLNILECQ